MTNDLQHAAWPGWETVRLIGRGSFGAVYEIQRNMFGNVESAALKVISIPQNLSDIEELQNDGFDQESITSNFQDHLAKIIEEYSLMKKMSACVNVVYCDDVRYVQHDDGIGWDIFIKMELLTPLTKVLPSTITDDMVVKLGVDVCKALEECKKIGVIHRDIKPQNIFVSSMGDYKLGDFGIAKVVERTSSGTKTGTYKYMAPEVYNNQPYGSGADIYSLGLVLYWMLNDRRTPFLPPPPEKLKMGVDEEARNRRLAGEPLPPPRHGSEYLKQVVLRACAYDPKNRFQSATEFRQALEGKGFTAPVPTTTIPAAVPGVAAATAAFAAASVTAGSPVSSPAPNSSAAPVYETPQYSVLESMASSDEDDDDDEMPVWKRLLLAGCAMLGIAAVVMFGPQLLEGDLPFNKPASTPQPVQKPAVVQPAAKPNTATAEWSAWADQLPSAVSKSNYLIDERTLYRSRQAETTSSTSSNKLDGWTLYDAVQGEGGYGNWSSWSASPVSGSSTREIQSQTRYRYRDKETTTSSSSSMSGWEWIDTTYSSGGYGDWSSWGTDKIYASDSRQVESKEQYSSRSITTREQYTDWSGWSSWQYASVAEDSMTDVRTRDVYRYYYFLCAGCGDHNPLSSACGCGSSSNTWVQTWLPISYSSSSSSAVSYATYKRQTTSLGDGQLWYFSAGNLNHTAPGTIDTDGNDSIIETQYSYRTRSMENVKEYGSWSSWSDSAESSSSRKEVRTRMVYRYREQISVPTYHFSRWGAWSDWSANAVSGSNSRQVESAQYYRYRDQVQITTYYFKRWGAWSDYSAKAISESDTIEVETKVQYRYKPKV